MSIKGYILWVRIVTLTFPDCELSTLDWSESWFLTCSSFPCSLFPIDNLSIYAQNFFKFCIHIVIGDEWYGIVNGQNPTIFDGVTALSPFKKWFLACYSFTVYDIWMKLHRYVEQQRLHITTKDRHSYLSSSWVISPWLIWKMFLTCSSFTIWNIWMKLHRYVDHQRLHIVTKDVISLSISVLLLFRHYISHKITFGAPSSGGVLCSACGAFIKPMVTWWKGERSKRNFDIPNTDFIGFLTKIWCKQMVFYSMAILQWTVLVCHRYKKIFASHFDHIYFI